MFTNVLNVQHIITLLNQHLQKKVYIKPKSRSDSIYFPCQCQQKGHTMTKMIADVCLYQHLHT